MIMMVQRSGVRVPVAWRWGGAALSEPCASRRVALLLVQDVFWTRNRTPIGRVPVGLVRLDVSLIRLLSKLLIKGQQHFTPYTCSSILALIPL
jgi:hypothetical protein